MGKREWINALKGVSPHSFLLLLLCYSLHFQRDGARRHDSRDFELSPPFHAAVGAAAVAVAARFANAVVGVVAVGVVVVAVGDGSYCF